MIRRDRDFFVNVSLKFDTEAHSEHLPNCFIEEILAYTTYIVVASK